MKRMTKTTIALAALGTGALLWAPSAHAAEATYVVTVGSVTVNEGAQPTASVPLSLSEVAPSGGLCLRVNVGLEGDSARPDNDYVAQPGQWVAISAGDSAATALVPIIDDLEAEVEQAFTISVSRIDCVGVTDFAGSVDTSDTGRVTVLDNDALPLTGGSVGLVWAALGLLGLGGIAVGTARRRARLA